MGKPRLTPEDGPDSGKFVSSGQLQPAHVFYAVKRGYFIMQIQGVLNVLTATHKYIRIMWIHPLILS